MRCLVTPYYGIIRNSSIHMDFSSRFRKTYPTLVGFSSNLSKGKPLLNYQQTLPHICELLSGLKEIEYFGIHRALNPTRMGLSQSHSSHRVEIVGEISGPLWRNSSRRAGIKFQKNLHLTIIVGFSEQVLSHQVGILRAKSISLRRDSQTSSPIRVGVSCRLQGNLLSQQ